MTRDAPSAWVESLMSTLDIPTQKVSSTAAGLIAKESINPASAPTATMAGPSISSRIMISACFHLFLGTQNHLKRNSRQGLLLSAPTSAFLLTTMLKPVDAGALNKGLPGLYLLLLISTWMLGLNTLNSLLFLCSIAV